MLDYVTNGVHIGQTYDNYLVMNYIPGKGDNKFIVRVSYEEDGSVGVSSCRKIDSDDKYTHIYIIDMCVHNFLDKKIGDIYIFHKDHVPDWVSEHCVEYTNETIAELEYIRKLICDKYYLFYNTRNEGMETRIYAGETESQNGIRYLSERPNGYTLLNPLLVFEKQKINDEDYQELSNFIYSFKRMEANDIIKIKSMDSKFGEFMRSILEVKL